MRTIVTKDDLRRATPQDDIGVAAGVDSADAAPTVDHYLDRLVKYIPAEVIAVYLTIQGILGSAAESSKANKTLLLWATVCVLTIATPFYLRRAAGVWKWTQVWISTASFLVWIFYLGGPFVSLPWYDPLYGAVLFPLFTFLVPLVEPER